MASELFEKGIKLRREVLGAEYVDKSMQNIDEFRKVVYEKTKELHLKRYPYNNFLY